MRILCENVIILYEWMKVRETFSFIFICFHTHQLAKCRKTLAECENK